MELNNFHYGQTLLELLYNISMKDDEYEEIALIGWGLIGNKRSRLYRYSVCPDPCTREIELPCNLDEIEAVTTNFEEWDHLNNKSENGDLNSAFTEHYIEHRKKFKHPLYASGKFVKYERVGNTLYLNEPYGKINILYKGEVLDDDGLPQITDKEATALATYCAYIYKFREGMQTNNGNIIQMAELLKSKWNVQVEQARNDYYISQNEWDEILDVKTNWDRKQHSRSFKMYR